MKKTAKPNISRWCLLASLFITVGVFGQGLPEQDCFSAIPVCTPSYNQPLSYSGSGSQPNEISPANSCLGAGELNSVWYIVTVQANGNLAFNIIPNSLTDDYDWAVFNLTNASCSDIATDPTLEVGCNFAGSTFPTSTTGPNGGSNQQDSPVIPVLAGETYAICVSNFSSTQSGYVIDFGIGGATAGVTDVTPPGVNGVSLPITCGTNQLTFSFSESVLCSSVSSGDFTLSGPDGPIAITAVNGAACDAGGTFEANFTLTLATPLTTTGSYTLTLAGPVTDNCQNPAPFPQPFQFNIVAVTANILVTDEFCGNNDGQIEIQASGGTPPYTYDWDVPIDNANTAIVTNLDAAQYSCTIIDANGCKSTVTPLVNDPLFFTISTTAVNDLCTSFTGSATVQVNGGVGPFNYAWNDPSLQTTPTASGISAGIYTVTVTDANNPTCQQLADATVLDFNDVTAGFYATPPEVLYLDPTVTFRNTSTNAISYQWDFGDNSPIEIIDNPIHKFPSTPGYYNVKLVVGSASGCFDTLVIPVRVIYNLNFYVPSAFTPNGDLINEEFRVYSDGINYNDFEMGIYDRYGHLMFYTTNPFEMWNGAKDNKGEVLPDGIYIYNIRFTQLYDNIEHKYVGKVALIR